MQQPLKNPRHELFAQGLAAGKTQEQAYKDAGFKPSKNARFSASRLQQDVNITQRVRFLTESVRLRTEAVRAKELQTAAYDRSKILKTIEDVVERCMQYQPVFDKEGNPVMVEVPGAKEGETKKIAAAYVFDPKNALKALEMLGIEREQMFIKRVEVRRSPLDSLPPEIARMVVQRLSELAAPFPAGLQRLPAREPVTIEQSAEQPPANPGPGPELAGQAAPGSAAGAAQGGGTKGS